MYLEDLKSYLYVGKYLFYRKKITEAIERNSGAKSSENNFK